MGDDVFLSEVEREIDEANKARVDALNSALYMDGKRADTGLDERDRRIAKMRDFIPRGPVRGEPVKWLFGDEPKGR